MQRQQMQMPQMQVPQRQVPQMQVPQMPQMQRPQMQRPQMHTPQTPHMHTPQMQTSRMSHSVLNPKFSPTMSSADVTNISQDKREPILTNPLSRPQEQSSQPVFNSAPLMNIATFLKNVASMSDQQLFNLLQNFPSNENSVEISLTYPAYASMNSIDPATPYFVTISPPMPGKLILTSALSQLGMTSMKHWMNMNFYYRSPSCFHNQMMTPVCDNHLRNVLQESQRSPNTHVHEASTQTVATVETQTEEEYFYQSCSMPKSKRGRRRFQF